MATDYYSDEGETPNTREEPAKETDAEGKTALLPKSFFAGRDMKPGQHCDIEIVRVHPEEVEVKYVEMSDEKEEKGEGEGEAPPQAPPGPMMGEGGGMAGMYE